MQTKRRASRFGFGVNSATAILVLGVALMVMSPLVHAKTLVGVFDPNQGRDQGVMNAMDAWQGKTNAVQTIFTTFDDSESSWVWSSMVNIWNSKHVPLITWEPMYWSQGSPTDITARVARGDYDGYVIQWGNYMKSYIAGPDGELGTTDDRRAFLRFAHEMNGNWYPWSAAQGGSTTSDYVNMWKRVYNIFINNCGLTRALVANSLKWVWSPINFDVGGFTMESYYPGDDYVDWVGCTGFNWGTSESWSGWWSVSDLFAETIPRLRTIASSKPVAITEFSSVSIGQGISGKDAWLNELFQFIQTQDIRMIAYFNMLKNEGASGGLKDWAIFNGNNGDGTHYDSATGQSMQYFASYKTGVAGETIVGSDSTNARVITDEEFAGWPGNVVSQPTPTPVPTLSGSSSTDSSASGSESSSTSDSGSSVTPIAYPEGNATTNATATQSLIVFSDSVKTRFTVFDWGSTGVQVNLNAAISSLLSAVDKALTGNTTLTLTSTQWGGAGFFMPPGHIYYISLASYSKLKFSLLSSGSIRIEIQDTWGTKYLRTVPSTGGKWKSISLSLSTPSERGTSVDFTRIYGLFLATIDSTGTFSVGNVRYA